MTELCTRSFVWSRQRIYCCHAVRRFPHPHEVQAAGCFGLWFDWLAWEAVYRTYVVIFVFPVFFVFFCGGSYAFVSRSCPLRR